MKIKKQTECPSALNELIDLVNSVPFGRGNVLPNWDTIISHTYFQVTGESLPLFGGPENNKWELKRLSVSESQSYAQAFEMAIELLKDTVKRFPKLYDHLFKLKNYPVPQNIYDEITKEAKERSLEVSALFSYGEFLKAHRDLRLIAHDCMRYAKTGKFSRRDELLERFGIKENEHSVRFIINSKGETDYVSEFVETTRHLDAKRLKICPICNEIFWAKRIEAPTCSKKCSNNFHQRKVRIKEYEARQELEYKKLEKLRNTLSPENKLISEQIKKLNKITSKINSERMKNGTL